MITQMLWEVHTSMDWGIGGDYKSTASWDEFCWLRDGAEAEGLIAYAPQEVVGDVNWLRQLYQPDNGDHMDSTVPGEGGYITVGEMSLAWTTPDRSLAAASPALAELIRSVNNATGDHATRNSRLPGLPEYSDEPMGLYVYPRYRGLTEVLLPLSSSEVTLSSNAIAGGAIWSWAWNGTDFVNASDYGRLIQAALVLPNGPNPTEAGDGHSDAYLDANQKHGSPIRDFFNMGSTQVTRATPLEFSPERFGGGAERPVVWKDVVLGKNVTLPWNGMPRVAQYTTVVIAPNQLLGAQVEIPTGYLRSEFSLFFTYNAASGQLNQVYPPNSCGFDANVGFTPAYGGVIVSNASATHAMGVYGASTAVGGSVSYFTLWKFMCMGDGGGRFAADTVKWDAVFGPATVPAGVSLFNSYIVVGSLLDVISDMHLLYLAGAM